jgi:hypothetical protein
MQYTVGVLKKSLNDYVSYFRKPAEEYARGRSRGARINLLEWNKYALNDEKLGFARKKPLYAPSRQITSAVTDSYDPLKQKKMLLLNTGVHWLGLEIWNTACP